MADDTRETTCGHYPYSAKGLCKKCYQIAWRAANTERIREYARQYAELNRDEVKERQRSYDRRTGGARGKKWKAANPDRVREYSRNRYLENKEAEQERARRYYLANRERLVAYSKAYREAHPEQAREACRRYQRANPEKIREINRQRSRRKAAGADLTRAQWRMILKEFDGGCAYCGRNDVKIVKEHMVPLIRGGRHTAANVVPACESCNLRKGRQTALEFAGWEVPPRRM